MIEWTASDTAKYDQALAMAREGLAEVQAAFSADMAAVGEVQARINAVSRLKEGCGVEALAFMLAAALTATPDVAGD